MWTWNGCCSCCKISPKTEINQLLNTSRWKIGADDSPNLQYYTVRRISSFGRTPSQEDVTGSNGDLPTSSTADSASLSALYSSSSELLTSKICKVQPESTETIGEYPDVTLNKQSGRWRRALHTLRPSRNKVKARVPPITVTSSPNLLKDIAEEESGELRRSGLGLRLAGTMGDMTTCSMGEQKARWLKSQSMQDINHAVGHRGEGDMLGQSPQVLRAMAAERLAKSCGLDTSLYSMEPSECHSPSPSEGVSPRPPSRDDPVPEQAWGRVIFTVCYVQHLNRLSVTLHLLEGLPPRGESGNYDVVVWPVVLPTERVATSAMKLGEELKLRLKERAGRVLRLSVVEVGRPGRFDAIGHVLLPLQDLVPGQIHHCTLQLSKSSQLGCAPGSVQVALQADLEEQSLRVVVMQARGLLASHVDKNSWPPEKYNTYVKVAYYCGGQKIKSKKSAIVSCTRNPLFNHTFNLKMCSKDRDDNFIVVSIMLKGFLKKDSPIGRLILGPHHYAKGHAITPWGRAFLNHEFVCCWFDLYL